MTSLYIALFVVISTLLFACALFVFLRFENRPRSNRKLPWEYREGYRDWHFNSARRERYACDVFRAYFDAPLERTEFPPVGASVCPGCLAWACREVLARLPENRVNNTVTKTEKQGEDQ